MPSFPLPFGRVACVVGRDYDGSAQSGGGVVFRLETEDVNEVMKKAVAAGAVVVSEVAEDESGVAGTVKDPYGVVWVIAAAVKSADPEA